jgi:hypothetical protein
MSFSAFLYQTFVLILLFILAGVIVTQDKYIIFDIILLIILKTLYILLCL